LHPDFVLNSRECLLQIVCSAVRQSKTPYGVSTFVDHSSHKLLNVRQWLLDRRLGRHAINCHVKLHGCAETTLKQSIVQVLSDPSSLREPFLKAQIHLSRELAQTQSIEGDDYEGTKKGHE